MVLGADEYVDEGPRPPSRTEPFPEPSPQPVDGEMELAEVVDLSHTGARLFGGSMQQSQPIQIDQEEVRAQAAAVADWLDRHLNDLQEGGDGGAVDAGLVGPAEVLTLTHPDQLVVEASYDLVVYARGTTEWIRAVVTVTRRDDSTVGAQLVFLPGDPPRLIAAEGEGEAPAPPAGSDAEPQPEDEPGEDEDA